ncbi:MAG: 30S ribosome-binding factor RbfA [Negativicutes bacterium]|nr:30S ribosome-binding factor RbfA [Negativicutes bacterium]
MGKIRVERVQELIKQELSQIIAKDLKDPRIGFVTVTGVKMTGDLQTATVFISLFGSEEEKAASWQGINGSLGRLRSEIGRRIRLRHTPEIILRQDTSLDYSERISRLLSQTRPEQTKKGGDGGES